MFESARRGDTGGSAAGPSVADGSASAASFGGASASAPPVGGPLDAAAVRAFHAALGALDPAASEAELVEQLDALETLKCAAAAAQARAAAALHAATVARHAEAGLPPAEQGRGVAAQVGLARRESPHRGGQHLGLARARACQMVCVREVRRSLELLL